MARGRFVAGKGGIRPDQTELDDMGQWWVAEGVGFEPTIHREADAGFQDRCLKPLDHPSLIS